ncbi:MAG: aldose 1-epimerase family protein [Bacteroidaceae bacterium]|nr:aldose 1-epimerase family protein [Bacteroidaceae bacterium]
MMEYLSNGILEIEISPVGAELQSIRRVASPTEYLWQGDAAYWDRRAPVLFPIVGRVWENKAHIDGQTYSIGQHGFLRDMTFEKVVDEDRHMAFAVRATAETRELWPFDFEVRIDYTLLRNVLTVGWSVTNHSPQPMPFQIGAHPAFQYKQFKLDDPVHGFLSCDAESPLKSTVIAPGGYAATETFDVEIPADGLLPLTGSTFECDTILETTGRLHRITLHDKKGRPFVTVRHTMPVTALWSPCGGRAPFLCIEPWHGCCDPVGFCRDFSRRDFIERAEPGETWFTSYEIIIE